MKILCFNLHCKLRTKYPKTRILGNRPLTKSLASLLFTKRTASAETEIGDTEIEMFPENFLLVPSTEL